ncbi:MAG: DPP IV N-terminal domain-containing protein, partial [Alistipes sp.]|nr:DPP IV N-terminal domain-containing protein [Alistipes sp.]
CNTSMLKDFWVINILKERPELFEYKYQMPGEQSPDFWLELFNAETMERREVDMAKYKEQMLFICNRPAKHADRYQKPMRMVWQGDNDKFYVIRQSRDIKRADLCVVDVATATAQDVIEEQMNTSIEWQMPTLINGDKEIIQWSERTGWAHLYRYAADGTLINQITKGEWHVSNVLGVDDAKRVIYFTATGYNKGENPYYLHLFRVNYDGTGLKQLDPKDFNGEFSLSDDRRHFVTTYSRADAAPVSELYTVDGKRVMTLAEVDLEPLFAMGYQYPEPFVVKAADGITDLHGVMFKPYDFDPNKKYPIIEYVYPGPQTEAVEQSWYQPLVRTDRLAQMGFIVITVGNRGGHPDRSKWYHNYGYGNLRDYGLKDKVVAAQQLAARHSFIDIERVGIHGHSGGGFMSTAAILMYPDFFDVAVSCAGNHDNNIYNRWWSEKHHGIKEVEVINRVIPVPLYDSSSVCRIGECDILLNHSTQVVATQVTTLKLGMLVLGNNDSLEATRTLGNNGTESNVSTITTPRNHTVGQHRDVVTLTVVAHKRSAINTRRRTGTNLVDSTILESITLGPVGVRTILAHNLEVVDN